MDWEQQSLLEEEAYQQCKRLAGNRRNRKAVTVRWTTQKWQHHVKTQYIMHVYDDTLN